MDVGLSTLFAENSEPLVQFADYHYVPVPEVSDIYRAVVSEACAERNHPVLAHVSSDL